MLSLTGTRMTTRTVRFTRPFTLGKDPRELPPGAYTVHMQEERYQGAFEPVYRAISAEFEVPALGGRSIRNIRPADLTRALARDQAQDEVTS